MATLVSWAGKLNQKEERICPKASNWLREYPRQRKNLVGHWGDEGPLGGLDI